MKLDSCGLPEDQFIEIFQKKTQFLGRLLLAFHPGATAVMDEKIAWEMFQECVYAAEAEARDIVNPESKDDPYDPTMFISRKDMMLEIKTVKEKVQALSDNISVLIHTEK